MSAESALQDFADLSAPDNAPSSQQPPHQPHLFQSLSTAAMPTPAAAQQHVLRPTSESQPSLRVSASHHTAHHTRLQPQQPAPSLKPCNYKPRASRTPHASRPLTPTLTPGDRSACTSRKRHARTLLSPATAAQTHPHRPTQAPPVTCSSSVPAFAMLVAASVAPTWEVAHSQLRGVPQNHPMKKASSSLELCLELWAEGLAPCRRGTSHRGVVRRAAKVFERKTFGRT